MKMSARPVTRRLKRLLNKPNSAAVSKKCLQTRMEKLVKVELHIQQRLLQHVERNSTLVLHLLLQPILWIMWSTSHEKYLLKNLSSRQFSAPSCWAYYILIRFVILKLAEFWGWWEIVRFQLISHGTYCYTGADWECNVTLADKTLQYLTWAQLESFVHLTPWNLPTLLGRGAPALNGLRSRI